MVAHLARIDGLRVAVSRNEVVTVNAVGIEQRKTLSDFVGCKKSSSINL